MNKKTHFVIIAGESSGDIHGAQIMKNLRYQNPDISFSGLGGPKMAKEGFSSLVSINRLAIMGFWEVLKNICFFFRLERLVLDHITKKNPEKIILIDYPGFNLRIAQKIKKHVNIKILYYVSPQLWAWKENRVKTIQTYVDSLIVLFPFEVEWYKKRNVHVEYFGHPLVETNLVSTRPLLTKKKSYTIALCPGSRQQEIKQHLPILIDVVQKTQEKKINLRFELFCAPNIQSSFIQQFIKQDNITINHNPILTSFVNIDFAIVASGTASLECAITQTPMVVIYKMSFLSWWLTKRFVKTPFASIVNVLANKPIIIELLQKDLTASRLFHTMMDCLQNPQKMQKKQDCVLEVIKPLAVQNVYQNTSSYIANY